MLLAACGGSSKPDAGGPGTTTGTNAGPSTTVHIKKAAENVPSESAKMICAAEAQKDIYEGAVGVKTVQPVTGKWDLATHTYSCDYVYPNGALIALSVREMSSDAETTAYFDELRTKLGHTGEPIPLGQGGFTTTNGSAVVRKDYKVLLVDVSKLPAQFGVPADTRANVALNVASTIMGCWTGA